VRPEGDPDAAIIADVLAGRRDRFAVLVRRYQAQVHGAMWRLTSSRDAAEELTQAVFVRGYLALGSFKTEYRLSTWLIRIGYHLYLNELRDQRREVTLDTPAVDEGEPAIDLVDPGPDPQDLAQDRETGLAIWSAVAELPDEFRAIFLMRHVDELSYEEICQATGLPMGTVKSRLARARRQLAERLVNRL